MHFNHLKIHLYTENHNMKYHKTTTTLSICLWTLIIVIGVGLFFLYDLSFETAIFWAKNYAEENMFQWILIFSIAYIVRPLFFIPATPFDLFSGMVFGPWYWFLISSISTFFTSMFGYLVGVLTGWIFIHHDKKQKKFKKLKVQLYEHTFFTTMLLRLMMFPYDLTNYICWMLKVPFFRFVWGTIAWILPACFIFVSAWAAFYGKEVNSYETLVNNINYGLLVFSSIFIIIVTIFAKVLKNKYRDIRL